MMRHWTNGGRAVLAALLLALLAAPAAAQAPRTEHEGAAALGLALRRLETTKRVLMIGAHPDDESTQILSTLALGQGAEVAYLSLTRGEGGQNGIGPELQEGLGLLRTEELLAARRLDGARQYFTRAYDYGFSKDADEAFRHWPRDSLLADVVAVVRDFRPDLILSVFSGTPRDGHGQHQASGILAREAFHAAADPARFPAQLRLGLRPHAAARLFQALWRSDPEAAERLSTGEWDPLFGRSYHQIAMASRSRHRSQDMGRPLVAGPQSSALDLVESRVPGAGAGPFAGIDTTLAQRVAGSPANGADGSAAARLPALLAAYQSAVAGAVAEFNPLRPGGVAPALEEAVRALAEAEEAAVAAGRVELAWQVAVEREEAERALWRAAGLVMDAVAADETVVPGQEVELELSLWNGGERPVRVEGLAPRLPAGWSAEPVDPLPAALAPGQLATRRFRLMVPPGAEPSEPYFLRLPREGDLYRWPAGRVVGVPFEAPPVAAAARVRVGDVALGAETAASYRGVDKMQGEFRRPVRVVPAVSVVLEPGLAILPLGREAGEPLRFSVRLRAERPGGIAGVLRPSVP